MNNDDYITERRGLIEEILPMGMLWISVRDFAGAIGRSSRFVYDAIRYEELKAIDFANKHSKRPFYGIAREEAIDYLLRYGDWLTLAKLRELKSAKARD